MKVLVVEDDPDIRELVVQSLKQAEYQVSCCADVSTARQLVADVLPDCLIVDWMLPDSSGVELIRWLRRKEKYRQIPIMMLTAKSQEADKILGLESGADDYMTKPMSLREMHARIKALIRRPAKYVEAQDTLRVGDIELNMATHELLIKQVNVIISRTEFRLLKYFMQNRRKVFSRDQLLSAVWGDDAYLSDRTVDVHILRLRNILKAHGIDDMIVTVRGAGYRFSDAAANRTQVK